MSQEQILSVFANNITAANSTGLYYAGFLSAQPSFPTGDYGSISGTTDAFGVVNTSIISFDCASPGPITTVDLGTSGSI